MNVDDPLHGGQPFTLAAGEAVLIARALCLQAQDSRWRISCSSHMISDILESVVVREKARLSVDQIDKELEVVELLDVAQP